MFRTLVTLALTLSAGVMHAADWPQFLGPTRDGVSTEAVAPWTAPPKVMWWQSLCEAHSSPVVAGGVVYAFFKPAGKNEDALAAFRADTGDKLWQKSYARAAFTPLFGVGPRGTPAVDGNRVYTLGNTGVLACWDAKTGDVAWKVDTLADFAAKNLFFGVSTSPIVVGDTVVVMVGGPEAGIVGFGAGKSLLQLDRPRNAPDGFSRNDHGFSARGLRFWTLARALNVGAFLQCPQLGKIPGCPRVRGGADQRISEAWSARRERSPRISVTWPLWFQPLKRSTT